MVAHEFIKEPVMLKEAFPLMMMLIIVVSLSAYAEAPREQVGSITNVEGVVQILRSGQEITAEKGLRLFMADVVSTGADGVAGIVLRDDTTLSLGPNSELKMSEFKFKPDEGVLGMTISIVKGTLVYIPGQIANLPPGAAKIETPAGVAAVRGTQVLIEVPEIKKMKRLEKFK